MKTTPNPSATKNRRGELVAPEPPEFPLLLVVVAAALAAVVVDGDILEVRKGRGWWFMGDRRDANANQMLKSHRVSG